MSSISKIQSQVKLTAGIAVNDRSTLESRLIVSRTRNYLFGMEYPASKIGLFRFARNNGAPEIVLHNLDKLPPKSYRSLAHVVGALKVFAKP